MPVSLQDCTPETMTCLKTIWFIYFIGCAMGRAGSQKTELEGAGLKSWIFFVTLDKSLVSAGPQFPHL